MMRSPNLTKEEIAKQEQKEREQKEREQKERELMEKEQREQVSKRIAPITKKGLIAPRTVIQKLPDPEIHPIKTKVVILNDFYEEDN